MFKEIYEIRNLSLSPEKVLRRLIEETAELVKPVLTLDLKEIRWCLTDIIAWVCAFANKSKIDLQKIMLKYMENPPGKVGKSKGIAPIEVIRKLQPETFEGWQRYLGYIYRNENQNITPELFNVVCR
jgi:NTP pyrophosphatase (non-canonical NTP hydrolase)